MTSGVPDTQSLDRRVAGLSVAGIGTSFPIVSLLLGGVNNCKGLLPLGSSAKLERVIRFGTEIHIVVFKLGVGTMHT